MIVAILYVARDFLIPLALSILLTFLLAPFVRLLEKCKIGRIAAVLVTVLVFFTALAGVGYMVGGQVIDLANDLPKYRDNLRAKVMSLRSSDSSVITNATQTLRDITSNVEPASDANPTVPGSPGRAEASSQTPATPAPVSVQVVNTAGNAFETLTGFITPLLAPLGTAALVIIFVIFMLLEREDLRDRIIHLMGRGHLQATTQALDEAGARVSRYLLAQLIVNVTYGIPVGIGLYFIGIPNAVLWGLLATVLRFIPYIGPWMAAIFPVALSLAVSSDWSTPIYTLGLFLVLELFSNNVVEPWLYGASTGLSPMAVIVAAAFWTWLWGAVGLLLATPLTVCLAVLGKYIPRLIFLDVLLGDKPPIAPENRFYQRLLAQDEEEVCSIAETYLLKHNLAETFDDVMVPALRLAEEDFQKGSLPENSRREMLAIMRELIAEVGKPDSPRADETPAPPVVENVSVLVLPANDEGDEICGLMLERLLVASGVSCRVLSGKLLASELAEACAQSGARQICISVIPPGSTRQGVYVCKKVRERFLTSRVVVGIWGEPADDDRRVQRFRRINADAVLITLKQAVTDISSAASVVAPTSAAASVLPAGQPAVA